jgi:hypothetical protein
MSERRAPKGWTMFSPICRWLVLSALMLGGAGLMAQNSKDDGSILIVFHVTSVKQDEPPDYCTTGGCTAVRHTVEGYSRVPGDLHYTQFTLRCVEMTVVDPKPHTTISCPRVRANGNYDAKLFADVLFFIDGGRKDTQSKNGPFEAGFDIVSQRETVKP